MKKIYSIILIGCFVLSGFEAIALQDDSNYEIITTKESIVISEPIIRDDGGFFSISIEQAHLQIQMVIK